jgi:hypothetical protein
VSNREQDGGMSKTPEEMADERGGVIAFRAPADVMARVDEAAASEYISRSDWARREVVRGLARAGFVKREEA